MLQVKSFKMKDDKGMNALLSVYRMAEGASILVSNGRIVIPFEDGVQESPEQKRVELLEKKFKIERELHIIEHSQKVLLSKVNGVATQLKVQKELLESKPKGETPKDTKEIYDTRKQIEMEVKRLENVLQQFELNMVNNQAEMTNKTEDIKVYEQQIEDLG